jgi:hypothetical protein
MQPRERNDPNKSNQSNVGRPISLVDKAGKPLEDLVASS